jgi:membrane protein
LQGTRLAATRERVAERAGLLRERSLAAASRTPWYAPGSAALLRDRRHAGGLLAGALAFRLFGALLPLALLAAVAMGYAATVDRTSPEKAGKAVGIAPALLSSVAESSKLSNGTRWTVAAFAVFALVWSAMSAARAIRAAYSVAWTGGVQPLNRAVPAGLVLVAAVVAVVAVVAGARWARHELGAVGVLVAIAAVVPFFGIWLGASYLLPRAGAPWTALVPGAVLVAVGMLVIHLGTVLFVANRVQRASATYGSFGAAFTILAWLYVVSRVIVASAMLNAALWERRAR